MLVACHPPDGPPPRPGEGEPAGPEMLGALCTSVCLDAEECGWFGVNDGGVCRKRCGAELFRYRWEYLDFWLQCLDQALQGDCAINMACRVAAEDNLSTLPHHEAFLAGCAASACCDLENVTIYSDVITEELIECLDLPCGEQEPCLASASASF